MLFSAAWEMCVWVGCGPCIWTIWSHIIEQWTITPPVGWQVVGVALEPEEWRPLLLPHPFHSLFLCSKFQSLAAKRLWIWQCAKGWRGNVGGVHLLGSGSISSSPAGCNLTVWRPLTAYSHGLQVTVQLFCAPVPRWSQNDYLPSPLWRFLHRLLKLVLCIGNNNLGISRTSVLLL